MLRAGRRWLARAVTAVAVASVVASAAGGPAVAEPETTHPISGRVDLAGADPMLRITAHDTGMSVWREAIQTPAADHVEFAIDWPADAGPALVEVEAIGAPVYGGWATGPGAELALTADDAVAVSAPADLGTIRLVPGESIRATVQLEDGVDPTGVRVTSMRPDGVGDVSVGVDLDGSVELPGIDPRYGRTLRVDATVDASYVGGWVNEDGLASEWQDDAVVVQTGGDPVRIRLDRSASISGALQHTEGPYAVRVDVRPWIRTPDGTWESRAGTYTNDGNFTVRGLRAGQPYVVCIEQGSGRDSGCFAGVGEHVVPREDATPVVAPADGLTPVVWRPMYATVAPAITGVPVVGQELSVTPPTWSVDAATSYQWYSDEEPITGAVSASYTPVARDLGRWISVRVTGTRPGYLPYSVGAWVGWAGAGSPPSGDATVTGRWQVGSRLTVSSAGWPAGTTFAYEWLADGRVVGRASTLDLTPDHYNHLLVARLRASQPGHENAVMDVDSYPVAAAPAPRLVKAPTLVGAQRSGSTITVSPGTWSVPGVRFSYSWRSGNITSADNHSARKLLGLADIGRVVRVHVVVSAPGYESTSFDLATRTIPRLTPTMRATLARTTVSTSSRGRVTVTVRGQVGATGTVTVRYGSRTVSTPMKVSSKNKVTVTLPRLKKGSYKVSAIYVPTGGSAKVLTSKKVSAGTLRVR